MKVVSVDLDNTLISTGDDYTNAFDLFVQYMNAEFDLGMTKDLYDKLNEVDYRMLETHGLAIERFPTTLLTVAREYVDELTDEQEQMIEHIAYSAYRNYGEYQVRGFMPGAEQMLRRLSGAADKMYLTTVGDARLQQSKIDALDLDRWFDDVFIVPYNTETDKHSKEFAFEKIVERTNGEHMYKHTYWHVGDSERSDIDAATNVGFNAIRVAEKDDWLTEKDDANIETGTSDVLRYTSAVEFVDDFDTFIKHVY